MVFSYLFDRIPLFIILSIWITTEIYWRLRNFVCWYLMVGRPLWTHWPLSKVPTRWPQCENIARWPCWLLLNTNSWRLWCSCPGVRQWQSKESRDRHGRVLHVNNNTRGTRVALHTLSGWAYRPLSTCMYFIKNKWSLINKRIITIFKGRKFHQLITGL